MEIKELYQLYKDSYLVDTDTRKIRNGSIFFALKGENFNGNKFALDALNKGAKFCVIDEEKYFIDDRTILVDDVLNSGKTLMYATSEFLTVPLVKLSTLVLVNRNHNIYPIKADYEGMSLSTTLQDHINVVFGKEEGIYLS